MEKKINKVNALLKEAWEITNTQKNWARLNAVIGAVAGMVWLKVVLDFI